MREVEDGGRNLGAEVRSAVDEKGVHATPISALTLWKHNYYSHIDKTRWRRVIPDHVLSSPTLRDTKNHEPWFLHSHLNF